MEDGKESYPRPSSIDELLILDAKRRVVGIKDNLVPISALQPQSWDFSKPTLLLGNGVDNYQVPELGTNPKIFAEEFYKTYPILMGVPLDGMLIAGSSVGQFISKIREGRGRGWRANDLDLFLYGHKTTDDSYQRILRFISDLEKSYRAHTQVKIREAITKQVEIATREVVLCTRNRARREKLTELENYKFLLEIAQNPENFEEKARTVTLSRPVDCELAKWEQMRPARFHINSPHIVVIRTSGSISIEIDYSLSIQIILRHYATASEILHGFDLGSSACGFDGDQVFVTELGRFAYEYGYNIIDTTRRSTTYEARLAKYFNREFGLILPHLDVNALPRHNLKYNHSEVVDLPYMSFVIKSRDNNRLILDKFIKSFGRASDYDINDEDNRIELEYTIAYKNLAHLVNLERAGDTSRFIYYAQGYGYSCIREVFTKGPHLTPKMIQDLYDQFRKTIWDGNNLNIGFIKRYLPEVPIREIAIKAFIDDDNIDDIISNAFATQRVAAVAAWNRDIRGIDHSILPWITENPGGQKSLLTGSLNPIIEKPAEWYGKYMIQQPDPSNGESSNK